MPRPRPRPHTHVRPPAHADDFARRRKYFKTTVSIVISVCTAGLILILQYTIRHTPLPQENTAQRETRLQIITGLTRARTELNRLPSWNTLINQIQARASTTNENVFNELASKIAEHATSTATSTPESLLPTSTHQTLP